MFPEVLAETVEVEAEVARLADQIGRRLGALSLAGVLGPVACEFVGLPVEDLGQRRSELGPDWPHRSIERFIARCSRSLYWVGLNKAKKSVEIDTSSPEGRELVAALRDRARARQRHHGDQRRRPALAVVRDDAGRRDDVIVVHIAGRSDGRPAVDYTVNCEVGLPYVTGPVDFDRPVNHVLPAWDLLTGLHAALAVLAAERVRTRTGQGPAGHRVRWPMWPSPPWPTSGSWPTWW